MRKNNKRLRVSFAGTAATAALLMGAAGAVQAYETSVAGGSLRWGNNLRYNLGMRLDDADKRTVRATGTDESTSSADKNDIVLNRLDLLSELEFDYQGRFGFRISGAAWYDASFDDKVKTGPGLENVGSYVNNKFSDHTKRFHQGPSGELLDAFVYANFTLGDMFGDIKVGRQTNLWGEAVALTTHSVSYNQAPADGLKAAVSPGADAREISMPVGQVHASLQVNDKLSLAAQYYFEWENTRLTEGGTFFASSDIMLEGPDRMIAGYDANGNPIFLRNAGIDKPSDSGDWGISARYDSDLVGGIVGFYYREFTERAPVLVVDAANGVYRLTYPEDGKLFGLSYSTLVGSASVGTELVYRQDTVLASGAGRGNTIHGLANAIVPFGPSSIWSSASMVAEVGFVHLDKVEEGAVALCDGRSPSKTGCLTRNAWQGRLSFSPTWTAVVPGWDVSLSTAVSMGLKGNSVVGGGGNEKSGNYSIGTTVTYNNQHNFTLNYIDYVDPRVGAMEDRGWLSFMYKTDF